MAKLKEKIIDNAYKMVSDSGHESVTLRSIARELEVTHPAIYTYFKSKDQLLNALKHKVLQEFKAAIFSGINPHGTTRQIMQTIANNFMKVILEDSTKCELIFSLSSDQNSREVQLQILEYIDQLLLLPPHNINIAQIFWYGLIGMSYAWYSNEITSTKMVELSNELIDRLSRSQ